MAWRTFPVACLGLSAALSVSGCGGTSDDSLFSRQTVEVDAGAGGTDLVSAGGSATEGPLGSGGRGGTSSGAAGRSSGGTVPGGGGSSPEGGNGVVADAGPSCVATRFYLDADGDGFGDRNRFSDACDKPSGHVTNSEDCYDDNENAHPGQTGLFGIDRGDGSYDYDCNGEGTPAVTDVGHCGTFPFCSGTAGWKTSSPPCGASTTWLASCTGLTTICAQKTETRVQQCL